MKLEKGSEMAKERMMKVREHRKVNGGNIKGKEKPKVQISNKLDKQDDKDDKWAILHDAIMEISRDVDYLMSRIK